MTGDERPKSSLGTQLTGTTSAAQTVTVTNTGNALFNITGTTMRVGDAFVETHTCGASLAPGASCTVSISFRPTAIGPQTNDLIVRDFVNDIGVAVPVSGTGAMAPQPVGAQWTGAAEGGTTQLTAQFADDDPGQTHTCAIAWGDGATTVGTVTRPAATILCAGSHLYEDNAPNNGTYPVVATLTDNGSPQGNGQLAFGLRIANSPPSANFTRTVNPDGTLTLALTNPYDISPADRAAGFTYAFNCGSGYGAVGTAATAICPAPGTPAPITRGKIIDKDGGAGERTSAPLTNYAPFIVSTEWQHSNEGGGATLTALFVDSNPGDTHSCTIDWSDGTSELGAVTEPANQEPGGCVGNHPYADNRPGDQPYNVVVTITDSATPPRSATQTVGLPIANRPPAATFGYAADGDTLTLALTAPTDPSPADRAAGFTYAFDCGDGAGYGPFAAASTRACTLPGPGSRTVKGQLRDKDGGVAEYTTLVTIEAPPLTATLVGPTTGPEGAAIALTASASIDASTFAWAVARGGTPVATGSGPTVGFTPDDDGDYAATVTVTDPYGRTATATATVAVSNVAPTATFTAPATATASADFTLALTAPADPGAADRAAGFSYAFDCGDGGGYAPFTAVASHTCRIGAAGPHTVRGQLRDKDGGVREYTAPLDVTPAPATVAITGAPTTSAEGTAITLGADASANVTAFAWTVTRAGATVATGSGTTFTFMPADDGTDVVAVVATWSGGTVTASATIQVTNVAPTATLTAPTAGAIETDFTIALTAPGDPGTADTAAGFAYAFDCDDGGGYVPFGTTPNRACRIATGGTHTVRGRIRDKDGAIGEYSATVAIQANRPPSLNGSTEGEVGEGDIFEVQVDYSDPDSGDLHTCAINWGDGTSSAGTLTEPVGEAPGRCNATHAFADSNPAGAPYPIVVTITDNGSPPASGTHTKLGTVLNRAPSATFDQPGAVRVGSTFTLALTGATDPGLTDRASLTYAFDCGAGYGPFGTTTTTTCTAPTVAGTLAIGAKIRDKDSGESVYTATISFELVPPFIWGLNEILKTEGDPGFTLVISGNDFTSPMVVRWNGAPLPTTFISSVEITATVAASLLADSGTASITVAEPALPGAVSNPAELLIANVAPTATLVAPTTVPAGTTFQIALTNPVDPSTADVAAGFTYALDCGSGYGSFGTAATATCTAPSAEGWIDFRGKIRDKDGGESEYAAVAWTEVSVPTVTSLSPATKAEGAVGFTLTVNGTNFRSGMVVRWKGADRPTTFVSATLLTATIATADVANSGIAGVTVADPAIAGAVSSPVDFTITNVAPAATFAAPTTVTAGDSFTLALTGPSDPSPADTTVGFTYAFDCGAGYGATSAAASVSCTAAGPGTRTVRGKVFDQDGGMREYTATVAATVSVGRPQTWGSNGQGQLGIGTTATCGATACSKSPLAVASLSTATALAGGGAHTVVLKADGTVWAWGLNSSGQLGDSTTTNRTSPVQVGGLTGVIAIAAGADHSLALKSDGTVWAWGSNANGKLGDGTTTNRSAPVRAGTLTGITQIGAGAGHSLALKSDGTIWAWGLNTSGQLGDNTTTQRTGPIRSGTLTGATAIAAGDNHSLALKSDGTAWAWGLNSSGQVGNGNTTNQKLAVRAGSSLTGITAVAAGGGHSLALKSDGTVWTWGLNGSGQLGDNTTTNRTAPVRSGTLSGVSAIAAGGGHSLAVKTDGTAWAWGANALGQIGDGTTTNRKLAVQVIGLVNITVVFAGKEHSFALRR